MYRYKTECNDNNSIFNTKILKGILMGKKLSRIF